MSSLFDAAVLVDTRVVNGRECRFEADPDDELFGGKWVPVDPEQAFTPTHKDNKKDPVAAEIIRRETEFRRRAKEWLTERGYRCYDVASWTTWQEWDPVAHKSITRTHRKDLFGLFDIEAYRGLETVGVQFTSQGNLGAHVTKMCAHEPVGKSDKRWRSDYLRDWLDSGRTAMILGFYQEGGKGSRWLCDVRHVTLDVLNTHEPRRRTRK